MTVADHIHFNDDGTAWWVIDGPGLRSSDIDSVRYLSDYDEPCDTCGGEGVVDDLDNDGAVVTCEWCDGTGRHTFTVEVSCMGDTERCRYVMTEHEHTIRVSVVPGMVLPIHDRDNLLDGDTALDHDWQPHITVSADQALLCVRDARYTDDWDERAITLPPAAKPGMWAVKLEAHP